MPRTDELLKLADERCGPKIDDWTRWICRASKADLRRELTRLYSAHNDDIEGDLACKIMSYDDAHLDAVDLGYPSLTEALEHLSELIGVRARSTGGGGGE